MGAAAEQNAQSSRDRRSHRHHRLLRTADADRLLLLAADAARARPVCRRRQRAVVAHRHLVLPDRLQRLHLRRLLGDGLSLRYRRDDPRMERGGGDARRDDLPGGAVAARPHHQPGRVPRSPLQSGAAPGAGLDRHAAEGDRRRPEDLRDRNLRVGRDGLRPSHEHSRQRRW